MDPINLILSGLPVQESQRTGRRDERAAPLATPKIKGRWGLEEGFKAWAKSKIDDP